MQRVSTVEGDGVCGKATKIAAKGETGTSCKGKGTGRREEAKESRRGRSGAPCTGKSTARMEEELNRRAKEESRRTLWQRGARRSMVARIGVVYLGNNSNL